MKALYLACTLALAPALTASAQPTLASAAAPAVFNTKRFVISDYGALADGKSLNTVAIQKAIDTAATQGSGLIVVPKGTFMSGSIFMKKGVELWLDEGAVLPGSPNIADYPTMKTRIEGHFPQWTPALVNFPLLDNIVIRNVTGSASFFGGIRGNLPNAERGTLGDTIGNFTLENFDVRLTNPAPLSRGEIGNLVYKNVVINGKLVEEPPATPASAK